MNKVIIISFILSILTSAPSFSASFNCKKAGNDAEHLICSNHSISYLDEHLSDVYKSLIKTLSNNSDEVRKVREEQRKWITLRNSSCRIDIEKCKSTYKERIERLRDTLSGFINEPNFVIDRQSCRASKNQDIIIRCIELSAYDPCEDSGGKWGAAQCGWAHNKIAEKKIEAIEKKIRRDLELTPEGKSLISSFDNSITSWRDYREAYCKLTNQMSDLDNFDSIHLSLAYCYRRTAEKKLSELMLLSKNGHP
ncbi:lysozyme inhibitor LprI family protein [Microbulbifer thermotolerans]|uniref:lysozyme inhibitor LprI family protein n=1 Tax=Microbulbifer thermotolerans TaxID=252514 RepID=UPI00224B31C9|nr:lysozyme inhibitor LprI family protein [Microbulbifer thermotolerans]MCX2784655.1 lysozyme inhibitor LprI family protein [Microbulbifer thermotolerans]